MMTKDQAQKIAEKILSLTKADGVAISINGGSSSNLRFARNTVTTSGTANDTHISLSVTLEKRQEDIHSISLMKNHYRTQFRERKS